MTRQLLLLATLLGVLSAPRTAAAQRQYGDATYTARGGAAIGVSDIGLAAGLDAEVTDWRLHPLGVGGRVAVLTHAELSLTERTMVTGIGELSWRLGSRRTFFVLTAGAGIGWVRELVPEQCVDAACTERTTVIAEGMHAATSMSVGGVHHVLGGVALHPALRLDALGTGRWCLTLTFGIGATLFELRSAPT